MRSGCVLVLFILSLCLAQPPKNESKSFRGRVYDDETGIPAAAAEITLVEEVYGTRTFIGKAITNERGAFAFAGVHLGSYSLYVKKAGFLTKTVVELAPGRDIVVRLERVVTVSGRVLDGAGRVLENALIAVTSKSYAYGEVALVSAGLARTDNQGLYRVSGLPPGQYYVRASCEGYETLLYPSASGPTGAQEIDLMAGTQRREINFRLERARRFKVSGHLMDAETNSPARAAFLRAYRADPVTDTFANGFVHEGQFRIEGMEPGRYFLRFDWVGATNNVTRTVVFPFEMSGADQTDVVLTAMRRATISGHVRTGKHQIPKSITVTLLPSAAAINAHVGGNYGRSAEIREDGMFRMTGVEAGEYRLGIHSGAPPSFFVTERNLTVDGTASITGADIELDFSAGSVVGRAVDSTREIIPSAMVVLQSIDVEKRSANQYRHILRASKNGEFAITGVVPGDYFLFVWRRDPGLIGDPALFATASERASRLRVPRGGTIFRNATTLPK